MRPETVPEDLLNRFRDEWALGDDPRFNEIMQATLNHMHQLIWEVKPSDDEWLAVLNFLTQTGKLCDDWRDEFQLLSDVLGLTTSINEINHEMPSGLTDSAVLGPFYAKNSPEYLSGESIIGEEMEGGELTLVRGHVLDTEERPIEGALLDIWQVAPNAMYAIQDKDQKNDNLRAWIYSQADGSYSFITYKPPPYPIPRDGTVGQLLNLGKRHGMRPAHIHYIVSAKGYEQVTTQLFTHDDPYLWSDAVFGEKNSLLVKYDQINDPDSECKWLLEFDFRMLKADG